MFSEHQPALPDNKGQGPWVSEGHTAAVWQDRVFPFTLIPDSVHLVPYETQPGSHLTCLVFTLPLHHDPPSLPALTLGQKLVLACLALKNLCPPVQPRRDRPWWCFSPGPGSHGHIPRGAAASGTTHSLPACSWTPAGAGGELPAASPRRAPRPRPGRGGRRRQRHLSTAGTGGGAAPLKGPAGPAVTARDRGAARAGPAAPARRGPPECSPGAAASRKWGKGGPARAR